MIEQLISHDVSCHRWIYVSIMLGAKVEFVWLKGDHQSLEKQVKVTFTFSHLADAFIQSDLQL